MALPEAVIFDMDGTLVDTERVSQTAWRRAAADFDLNVPERIWHAFVGCSLPNARAMINAEFGDPALTDRLFAHQRELFFQIEDEALEPCAGALEALAALSEASVTLALATSTARERALPTLDRFGMVPYFTSMTFGDEIERAKPEPDIFLLAAEKLGADPARCFVVEDSANGIRAGHAAGMRVIMVPDLIAPKKEITSLCEVVLSNLDDVPGYILDGDVM